MAEMDLRKYLKIIQIGFLFITESFIVLMKLNQKKDALKMMG
jgi:hypothetical protein